MINTFIIAALSADGFITPPSEFSSLSTTWTSAEDKKFFIEKTKEARVFVMGSTTFETFGARPLKNRRNIIYSRNKKYEGAETTSEDPKDLVQRLEKEGHAQVAICGGSSIYSQFLKAGIVNKIYLTIQPVIFGQGINLFDQPIHKNLKLENSEKLGDNTVLLEYSVIN
jgi:dihydrofolate reductase